MATTGQTINDRLNAVRYALVGQGLARTVCKATTEEVIGPKKKHIDYLLACTNEPNVSIPQMANLLIERTQHTSWAVVFKSLISIHHLISYGNERFTQYLATSNHSFELADFMDRTTPQGYNMSTFVRRYAKYINDKTISYRTLAIDLCKIRSGNDNALRVMNMDNLSKTLPIVQAQFDSLLEFGAETKDLNNGIITSAFRLLYKDLVKLYVAYQEAIINLLERYFKLSRKKTREALDMYKKYLARMDKVAGFLRVVDAVGLDKSEMPDLTKSPASILALLEDHLAKLEAKKRGGAPASPEAQGDEEGGENKENESQSVSVESATGSGSATAAAAIVEPTPSASVGIAAGQEGKTAEQTSGTKQTPPQKPARPPASSPRVSPKVSPSKPPPAKPAAPSTAAATTTAAATAGSSPSQQPATEKKGPPERPAKPPSRPPPPTSVAPAPAAAAPGPPSSTGQTDSGSAPAARSSQPPAHPPQPQAKAASPTPPPSAAPVSPTTTPQQASIAPNNNTSAGDTNTNGRVVPPEEPPASSACSANANPDNASSADIDDKGQTEAGCETQEVETNHVNNNNNTTDGSNSTNQAAVVVEEAEEVAMPPPPPLDDVEAAPAEPAQEPPAEAAPEPEVAQVEPVINGQNGTHDGE